MWPNEKSNSDDEAEVVTSSAPASKSDVMAALQADILRLQGFHSTNNKALDIGLGPIAQAFPNGTFPLGAVHEFLAPQAESASATCGFLAGLLSTLIGSNGAVLWISATRTLFPPALKAFGLAPDQFIFIDVKKEQDVLWVMDEALKCGALTAVVGEMKEISFTASRRLQLAVEQSQVTGFILRSKFKNHNTTASVSRWKITSMPSEQIADLPGIGFPRWRVELLRIRNGKAGAWDVTWMNRKFQTSKRREIISDVPLPASGVNLERYAS